MTLTKEANSAFPVRAAETQKFINTLVAESRRELRAAGIKKELFVNTVPSNMNDAPIIMRVSVLPYYNDAAREVADVGQADIVAYFRINGRGNSVQMYAGSRLADGVGPVRGGDDLPADADDNLAFFCLDAEECSCADFEVIGNFLALQIHSHLTLDEQHKLFPEIDTHGDKMVPKPSDFDIF